MLKLLKTIEYFFYNSCVTVSIDFISKCYDLNNRHMATSTFRK